MRTVAAEEVRVAVPHHARRPNDATLTSVCSGGSRVAVPRHARRHNDSTLTAVVGLFGKLTAHLFFVSCQGI